ncbi:MAG: beta-propeller domain-containing protein [Clostridia bacterium]|nr:beta-propeller domain-containing protein [Clostridia bacterium]
MKNNDFNKKLSNMLNSEEITLPESLSAYNIETLINEKGGIVNPRRSATHIGKRIVKIMASAAAVIVLLVGVLAVADISMMKISEKKQEEVNNTVIEDTLANSDYSEIEAVVLNYYKNIFNSANTYESFADKMAGAVYDAQTNGTVNEEAYDMEASNTAQSTNTSSNDTAGTHSTTNVQVSGVDEADIIKNDGRYIYYLNDNILTVTDCENAENMSIVSQLDVCEDFANGYANEMYIYGNKLIVLINVQTDLESEVSEKASEALCDCFCVVAYFDTVINVYDITDKSDIELEYTQTIDGEYVTSRLVDGRIITVSSYSIPYDYVTTGDFTEACEAVKGVSVPCYNVNGGEVKKVAADAIECFDEDSPTQYTVTAVTDLDTLDEPKVNAYLGGGYEVYCTADEMFIAETVCSYWTMGEEYIVTDENGVKFQTATHIYKFDITDDGVIYVDDVVVGGTFINQFSMDKYGDYFRIATTGAKYGKDSATFVYVLDKDLKVVGYIEDIAKGEDMKSARFMGNTLYLVTFYQTDPLFVIDLTDPTKPEIKGELKIPGFSSYLHPIGNNLVIGVGEGGTMNGTDGSAKVSLFDVSDPCDPKEIDNYTVADAYFDTNHKAFMTVDADTFGLCLYSRFSREDHRIMMFDVTENGLTIHGEYSGNAVDTYYGTLRGAFIGDTIFAVNGYGIKAYSMTTNELLGEAEF